ncbi:MAG: hypothetical protein JSU99_07955 [Nitrospiraceae bacterium]|nr:MAG: hypothetical protein JSU99_07955 [Nitrospiraceae bacterium]
MIMRLVFYQKRIRLAVEYEKEKATLFLDGTSEYYKYSFEDEMEKLAHEMNKFVQGKREA